jgi:hypothetical protein
MANLALNYSAPTVEQQLNRLLELPAFSELANLGYKLEDVDFALDLSSLKIKTIAFSSYSLFSLNIVKQNKVLYLLILSINGKKAKALKRIRVNDPKNIVLNDPILLGNFMTTLVDAFYFFEKDHNFGQFNEDRNEHLSSSKLLELVQS